MEVIHQNGDGCLHIQHLCIIQMLLLYDCEHGAIL